MLLLDLRWMVDSGATHHISPHRLRLHRSWTPTKGKVSLGGHAEIDQIGTGTVEIRPLGGDKICPSPKHDACP